MVWLHVLTAVLVTGPAVYLPFTGLAAIRGHHPDLARQAARLTAAFNIASLVVFGSGLAAVGLSDEIGFGTPWVVISTTLYLVAAVIGILVLPPILARGAKSMPGSGGGSEERVQRTAGRIIALGTVLALLYGVITTLMVLRPFED
jgi:uncharacterized membrane protein